MPDQLIRGRESGASEAALRCVDLARPALLYPSCDGVLGRTHEERGVVERQDNIDEWAKTYSAPRSPAGAELVERVLGTSLANGYTTLHQAAEVAELLDLGSGDRALDLGAGRGWPGIHLAERGCALVAADLTVEAAMLAKECIRAAGLQPQASIVVADGGALPFRAGVFNAVVHADVLC